MMTRRIVGTALFLFISGVFPLFALDEISIERVVFSSSAPHRYHVAGKIINRTNDVREVVYRAQVTFYERAAPKGDKPAFILRKDATIVLKPKESRKIREVLISEGTEPKGSLRPEPMLRVRRQRVWQY